SSSAASWPVAALLDWTSGNRVSHEGAFAGASAGAPVANKAAKSRNRLSGSSGRNRQPNASGATSGDVSQQQQQQAAAGGVPVSHSAAALAAAALAASYRSAGTVQQVLRAEQLSPLELAMEYQRLYSALTQHFSNPAKLWDVAYPLFLHAYYELHNSDLTAATAFLESHLATVNRQPLQHHAARQLGALREWVRTCGRTELHQLCQPPASAVAPIGVTPDEEAELSRAFEAAESLELAWRAFRLVRPADVKLEHSSATAPPVPSAAISSNATSTAAAAAAASAATAKARRIDAELRDLPDLANLLAAASSVSASASASNYSTTTLSSTTTSSAVLPTVWRASLQHVAGAGLTCCSSAVLQQHLLVASGYDDCSIRVHQCRLDSTSSSLSTFASWRLRGHSGCPHAVAFASGAEQPGRFLVSAGDDAKVLLWRLPGFNEGDPVVKDADSRLRLKRRKRRFIKRCSKVSASIDESDEELLVDPEEHVTEHAVWPLVSYLGHDSPVWCCDTHPYNASLFATGGQDRTAVLWCTDRQTPLRQFIGHVTDVDLVGFHPSGSLMYTAGLDSTVRLWDLNSGRCVRLLCNRDWRGCVNCVAVSPSDGRLLAVAGEDRHVRVFDLAAGTVQPLWDIRWHRDTVACLAWSPCSTSLASLDLQRRLLLWPAVASPAPQTEPLQTANGAQSCSGKAAGPFGDIQLTDLNRPLQLLWPASLPQTLSQPHHQPSLLAVGSALESDDNAVFDELCPSSAGTGQDDAGPAFDFESDDAAAEDLDDAESDCYDIGSSDRRWLDANSAAVEEELTDEDGCEDFDGDAHFDGAEDGCGDLEYFPAM
ncbi:hypothetical protein BOX15_Mlig016887g2, partial [Macrostomum lignano]